MLLCYIMYQGYSIAVVVPAYNEELLIAQTLKSIPDYIDKIYAVDDGSNDRTLDIIEEIASKNKQIIPISHEVNRRGRRIHCIRLQK